MMARNAQQPTQNTSSHPFLWVIERCSQYDYPGWRRLTNASKHAFVGSERGEIELEFRQEGASWRLWVFDNGLGMSSDRMDASGDTFGKHLLSALAARLNADCGRPQKWHSGRAIVRADCIMTVCRAGFRLVKAPQ